MASAYVDLQNQMVSVEENEDFKAMGGLEYIDSQISADAFAISQRQASRDQSYSVDVQRAFKNRVIQFKKM